MTYYYTYKITCTAGRYKDKVYYGQHTTSNLTDGYKGSGAKIKRYYKKHPNDYVMEILNFYNNQDELDEAEYELIKPHLNKDYCLNLKDGGDKGIYSDESRKKISEALKGKNHSEKTKKKLSEANKGKTLSPETKQKMSESLKGKNKGKTLSDEVRKKISESRKGKTLSDETRKKISETLKGKTQSDETKDKISKANKGKHYYNNGVIQIKAFECPEGFVKGRLK